MLLVAEYQNVYLSPYLVPCWNVESAREGAVSLHNNTMLESEAFETEFADFDDLGDSEDSGAQHNRAIGF